MILEKLSVAGFRKFAEPFTFTPDARFTVVYAPNGTGKSTLLDALYYGLLERHTITGSAAEQRFKSLGRDLTPEITIDFAVDRERYRLRKVFLKAKSASLQRFEGGRYLALKDGTSADDFVRDLFFAEAPGRGPAEPSKHLGFAHVLWAPARASFDDLPASAGDQIRAMLGGAGVAVTEGERVVQERAEAEYLRHFRADGGFTTKAGAANVPALIARANDAHTAKVEARKQYDELERLSVAYADRKAEAERIHSLRSQLRTEIEVMKAAVIVFTDLEKSAERAARSEGDARTAHQRITSNIQSLAFLRAERDRLDVVREKCRIERNVLESTAAMLHESYINARAAVDNSEAAFAAVQRRAGLVTIAQSYVDSRQSLERQQTLITKYNAAAKSLADLAAAQAVIVAPGRNELETLREAAAQVHVLRMTIAASALSIEIQAESELTIDVIAGDPIGSLTLAAGSTTIVGASEDGVIVNVPGLGRIRACGTDGAATAKQRLQSLLAALEAARQRYGTSSIPELAAQTERVEQMQRTAFETRSAMTALLGGEPIEHVRESLATATAHVASIDTDYPDWHSNSPDATALRNSFDHDLQLVTDASRLAQVVLRAAEQPREDVGNAIAESKTVEAEVALKLESTLAQLKLLEQDGHDDRSRAEHEALLALTWSAAKAQQATIAASLAVFVEHPRAALIGLEVGERESGALYESALSDAASYQTQLNMQTNVGTYAKLVRAEETAAHCDSAVASAKLHASAIACLYGAFNRIQAERVASVIAPITSASTQYLTRIIGTRRGEIAISDGLSPQGLTDELSGLMVPINGTLSSGEKEQIYLATRLALADVIANQHGRQLFVVDDALTATDPDRVRRFIQLLEELSLERLQVIVTTADPSRYLGISGAKHLDLAAALNTNVAA